MRLAIIAFIGALGLAASAVSAAAAPIVPDRGTSAGSPDLVEVAGGCGRWAQPNRWGRCVPNGYGYYRPRLHGPGYTAAGIIGAGYRRATMWRISSTGESLHAADTSGDTRLSPIDAFSRA